MRDGFKNLAFRVAQIVGIDRSLRRVHRGKLKVLLYHNVESGTPRFDFAIPAAEFARHLQFLKQHCNVVSMTQAGEIVGMCQDRLNVLITFDDGFINNFEVAMPILQQHGLSATFFLVVDCLEAGSPPAFQLDRLTPSDDPSDWRTITIDEMNEMRRAGMTIGSHSLSHTDSRQLGNEALVQEALQSRERMEALLGEPVGCFALPWGHHNPDQPERLLEVFDRVFLTTHGFTTATSRILPRNEVSSLAHLPHAVAGTVDLFRSD